MAEEKADGVELKGELARVLTERWTRGRTVIERRQANLRHRPVRASNAPSPRRRVIARLAVLLGAFISDPESITTDWDYGLRARH